MYIYKKRGGGGAAGFFKRESAYLLNTGLFRLQLSKFSFHHPKKKLFWSILCTFKFKNTIIIYSELSLICSTYSDINGEVYISKFGWKSVRTILFMRTFFTSNSFEFSD